MKAIEVDSLTKVYSNGTKAVDDISFSVEEGEIFGMLGPNGAGKTTTIKMITTLAKPTTGSIQVFGVDAVRNSEEVRKMFGLVPQAISVDGDLTGYENLLIFAKLFYVDRAERRARILDALEYFGLGDRADDLVKNYSGGMMRRLEIAQALVNRPKILFLDEPSIGLDPHSKNQVVQQVQELNREFGTTILVTTHDMHEADTLCNRLAIMNRGTIAVSGPPAELKRSVGGDVLTLKVTGEVVTDLPPGLGTIVESEPGVIKVLTDDGERAIPRITSHFQRKGAVVESISLSRPTLDDVFMKYTKSSIQKEEGTFSQTRSERRNIARHAR